MTVDLLHILAEHSHSFIYSDISINGQRGANLSVAPIRNSNEELDAAIDKKKSYLSSKKHSQ